MSDYRLGKSLAAAGWYGLIKGRHKSNLWASHRDLIHYMVRRDLCRDIYDPLRDVRLIVRALNERLQTR